MHRSIRVLHVDDEPDVAELAATYLERADDRIEVVTETSVSDALDRLSRERIDCIVSDFDMPGQNGIEFLRTVRERESTVPFILFTGKGSEEVASDAISAGVSQYLQKETGVDQYTVLANQITSTVSKHRTEQELSETTQMLQTVLDNVPLVLFTLDMDGTITRLAGSGLDRTALDPDTVIGTAVFEVFDAGIGDQCERALGGTATDGVIEIGDGVFQSWIHPLFDDDGAQTGVLGVGVDITDRRERQRELERKTAAIDSASVGIVMTGPVEADCPITYANEEFERLTGYDTDEVLGRNCRFLQGAETDSSKVGRLRRAIQAEEPVMVDLWNYRKDGSAFINEMVVTPINPEDDEPTHFVGFQRDVTERHQQQKELQRQNDLFAKAQDIANVGAWEYDIVDDEITVTEQLHDVFELSTTYPTTLEGSLDFFHPEDRDRVEAAFTDAIQAGDPWDIEARIITDDDTHRWVRTRGDPQTSEGRVVRIRGTVQDISERKQQEIELERQNEQLKEFAEVVSHDLRNPLQVAKGYLEQAALTGDEEAFEQTKQAHERIDAIIEDVLTLARQGQRIEETTTVHLDEIAREAWSTVDTKEMTLSVEGSCELDADPPRVRTLFENLFRNAAEHAGPDVTVTVGPIEPMHATTRVTEEQPRGFFVSDTGPGIPEDKRDEVFDSGFTTASEGTGFGLAIVERIADAHRWNAAVSDRRYGGARFEFTEIGGDHPLQTD